MGKDLIGGLASQGVSMIHQGIQNKVNHDRQIELMGIQQQNQKKLNEQGHKLQKKMWDETNYGAQMKHIKDAGLNASLMYGMSGGGGTTTGSQGGGSATGGGVTNAKFMGMEALLLDKQIEVLESVANKNNADADKTKGADTENTQADTLNKQSQTALNKILGDAKNQEISQSEQQIKNLKEQQNLTEAQTKVAKDQLLTSKVMRENMQMKTKQSKQEIQKSISDVKLSWKKLVLDKKAVDQTEKSNNIKEFEAEMKTKYPSLFNVMGKIINDATRLSDKGEEAYNSVLWWLGIAREDRETVE